MAFSQANNQYIKTKVGYGVKTHIDKNLKSYKFLQQRMPDLVAKRESIASEFDFSLVFLMILFLSSI